MHQNCANGTIKEPVSPTNLIAAPQHSNIMHNKMISNTPLSIPKMSHRDPNVDQDLSVGVFAPHPAVLRKEDKPSNTDELHNQQPVV